MNDSAKSDTTTNLLLIFNDNYNESILWDNELMIKICLCLEFELNKQWDSIDI
jgi:hypothetical protein